MEKIEGVEGTIKEMITILMILTRNVVDVEEMIIKILVEEEDQIEVMLKDVEATVMTTKEKQ